MSAKFAPITDTERRVYRTRGDIRFSVPPVCTVYWDEDAWIRWYRGGPNFSAIVAEEETRTREEAAS